jgi:transcriptional regulator GlxA family with amidase domain
VRCHTTSPSINRAVSNAFHPALRRSDVAGEIKAQKKVAFVLLSGFPILGYAAATDFLRAANEASGGGLYHWTHVGLDDEPVVAAGGIEIACPQSIAAATQFDYVFVCAGEAALTCRDALLFAWLRRQASHGATIGGISSGAFLLARAGLLDGRRATTHWFYAAAFAEEFPHIDLRPTLFEIDGNRVTCGGATAAIDLMHRLFSTDHGCELADSVSEWFLHKDIRDGEHAQRQLHDPDSGLRPSVQRALHAMNEDFDAPKPRAVLARIAGVSERQLDRLFLDELGETVSNSYLRLRLNRARDLVLQSAMPHLEIAYACGFPSASSFSKAYRAAFGLPPSRDRAEGMNT